MAKCLVLLMVELLELMMVPLKVRYLELYLVMQLAKLMAYHLEPAMDEMLELMMVRLTAMSLD